MVLAVVAPLDLQVAAKRRVVNSAQSRSLCHSGASVSLPPSIARCTVEEVVVIVTFPAGVAGADVSATVGTVTFPLEEQKKNVVR